MRSKAQKEADERYRTENRGRVQVELSKAEADTINKYCALNKERISKARFIFWACNYFIGKGELPPKSEAAPFDEDTNIDE